MSWYRWEKDDLLLNLQIQPRASRDQLVGPVEDSYKVRITAPPVDGKANKHLTRFLAQAFGVPRSRVSLVTGVSSRRKVVRIGAPQKLPIPVNKSP